jgi:hypothetical protein
LSSCIRLLVFTYSIYLSKNKKKTLNTFISKEKVNVKKEIKKGRKKEKMTERSSTKHKENEGKISLTSYCDNS